MAVSLINEGCVSFKRTRELIHGFSGGEMNISEGYLVKLQKKSYDNLATFDNELHQKLLKLKVLNWDDTVIFINGKSINIIVKGDDLDKEEIAQIQNIVTRELEADIENIHIMNKED